VGCQNSVRVADLRQSAGGHDPKVSQRLLASGAPVAAAALNIAGSRADWWQDPASTDPGGLIEYETAAW